MRVGLTGVLIGRGRFGHRHTEENAMWLQRQRRTCRSHELGTWADGHELQREVAGRVLARASEGARPGRRWRLRLPASGM